jgi:hypothetical protein
MAWDCSRHRAWRRLQSRAKETERLHEADCFCVTVAGASMWKKHTQREHVSRSGVSDETGTGERFLRLAFAPSFCPACDRSDWSFNCPKSAGALGICDAMFWLSARFSPPNFSLNRVLCSNTPPHETSLQRHVRAISKFLFALYTYLKSKEFYPKTICLHIHLLKPARSELEAQVPRRTFSCS